MLSAPRLGDHRPPVVPCLFDAPIAKRAAKPLNPREGVVTEAPASLDERTNMQIDTHTLSLGCAFEMPYANELRRMLFRTIWQHFVNIA
jgi:hypothetical protein